MNAPGKNFAHTAIAVAKSSERLEVGIEIVKMLDGWTQQAQQLELSGADGMVAHVKLTSKREAAREILEMLAARGVRDVAGLSS